MMKNISQIFKKFATKISAGKTFSMLGLTDRNQVKPEAIEQPVLPPPSPSKPVQISAFERPNEEVKTKILNCEQWTPDQIENFQDRELWALLGALKLHENGNLIRAKELFSLAHRWGCDKTLIAQVLIFQTNKNISLAFQTAGLDELAKRQHQKAIIILAKFQDRLAFKYPDAFRFLDNSHYDNLIRPFDSTKTVEKIESQEVSEINLYTALNPKRLIEVVDIGANPIDGPPPYTSLLDLGICKVTGFEPNEKALEELILKKNCNERYLPHAIGTGDFQKINFYKASGMTSLYEIDEEKLGLFNFFSPLCELKKQEKIKTHRIDDLNEILNIDFLKIDIQGGELSAMQSGTKKLSSTVVIQTEVSFVTLYKGQPGFGEIDIFLRKHNFIPHCFTTIKKWPISPYFRKGAEKSPINQLLEADIVYIKDISRDNLFSDEQLKHLALISHYCYSSYDLTLKCLDLLIKRSALEPEIAAKYKELIKSK